jgi:glucose-6-phosphate isomerase
MTPSPPHLSPGPIQAKFTSAYDSLINDRVADRIGQRDHTLWKDDPTEISNRFGWLDSPKNMAAHLEEIRALADAVRQEGYTHALLLGMGGSSLAPEVFRQVFGVGDGGLDLAVLDSTHPDAVMAFDQRLDPARTLYLPATKSGGTVETLSFLKYFYNRTVEQVGAAQAGAHFAAITDPGSGLADLAGKLGFRHTFLNDPNIGGRYSALSFFGLVAAGLVGIDLDRLLQTASAMAQQCEQPRNPGLELGAFIGAGALAGRDKLTLFASPTLASVGGWVEQLVAESTGKEGKGILPVDLEPPGTPASYGNDRLFVHMRHAGDPTYDAALAALVEAGNPVYTIELDDLHQLGGLFFQWEIATIAAGRLLAINPFDQPDVEAAKILARDTVAAYHQHGTLPQAAPTLSLGNLDFYGDTTEGETTTVESLFAAFFAPQAQGPAPYIALQAYFPADLEYDAILQGLRLGLRDRHRLATTLGYGPRFLHSTGQLHKGDSGNGLFLQLTADPKQDAAIPDQAGADTAALSFAVLKDAQAMGDHQALSQAGRRVLRVHLGGDIAAGLERLAQLLP